MAKKMLIEASHSSEIRVAIVENSRLVDFDCESVTKKPLKGNIYLAKVVRVEPSLQAAFVEYGGNRHGFLAFGEIHPDYFRIPIEDRDRLKSSLMARESAEEAEFEEKEHEEVSEVSLSQHVSEGEVVDEAVSSSDATDDAHVASREETLEENLHPDDAVISDKEEIPEVNVPSAERILKRYKIQEVIKSRQILLVQVVKEERGNKGAALTTYISLAGRYCVLMPNASGIGGVSRKITDQTDRKRLKQLLQSLDVPEGMALIVRTAGMDRSKIEIKRDYKYLMDLWVETREATLKATAPELIYEEGDLVKRSIRDHYAGEIDEVLVEGEEAYKTAKDVMRKMMPSHAKRVVRYKEEIPLFYKANVEKQIDDIYQTHVRLKSGGYLVIHPTEALVAIDVNSGKATRERHIDSTALKTNLEAAEEVARQVRLRDLAGLIVVDFIDMVDQRHNNAVEKKLKDAMQQDRARVQIGRISMFGLLEMSRQRLRPSIQELSTAPCHSCGGLGYVRSVEAMALQVLRLLGEHCIAHKPEKVTVLVSSVLGFYLLNQKKKNLSDLEKQFGVAIELTQDDVVYANGYKIVDDRGVVVRDTQAPHGFKQDENPSKKQQGEGQEKKSKRNKGQPANSEAVSNEDNLEVVSDASQKSEEKESSHTEEEGSEEKSEAARSRRRRNRNRNRRGKGHPREKEGALEQEASEGEEAPAFEHHETETAANREGDGAASETNKKFHRDHKKRHKKKPRTSENEKAAEADDSTSEASLRRVSNPRFLNSEKLVETVDKWAVESDEEQGDAFNKLQPKKQRRKGWWKRLLDQS